MKNPFACAQIHSTIRASSAGVHQRCHSIQRVRRPAALLRRLGPFVDHGNRQAHLVGDVFRVMRLENLAQQFMRFHAATDDYKQTAHL